MLTGSIIVLETREVRTCRLKDEEYGEVTMRAVPVHRVDYGRRAKDTIGVVFEMRKTERVNNYNDLLRLARRLFAVDTADAVYIVIDVSHARRAILPDRARDCFVE
jgi:hypothetical protein